MSDTTNCPFCGEKIHSEAQKCIYCKEWLYEKPKEDCAKPFLKTILFCFFLGAFGVHRFYTGYIGIGIFQLLTSGGFSIWAIIDFWSMIRGNYRDINGNLLIKDPAKQTNIAGALSLVFAVLFAAFVMFYLSSPSNINPSEAGHQFLAFASIPIFLGLISIVGDSGKKMGILSIVSSFAFLILWIMRSFY